MEPDKQDWQRLALAFYSLAHNDQSDFNALEQRLKETEVGQLCADYIRTGDNRFLEKAGDLLTGTKEWRIALGRIF